MTITSSGTGTIETAEDLEKHLTLLSLTIGTFGGYRRATREAIEALGGSLPASRAITEGSIKVFPNEPLAKFHTIRRKLFRLIAKRGIKALGSSNVFAIPRSAKDDILAEIEQCTKQFADARTSLARRYERLFEDHVKKNLEAEDILRAKKFSKDEAIGKLTFSKALFRIQPETGDADDSESGVRSIVRGLGRQLFEEVAGSAEKLLLSDTFTKNGRAMQKTLRPIRALADKMAGLSFLDEAAVRGALQLIEEILKGMPNTGYIEDAGEVRAFTTLRRLVEVMADADLLVNAASKIANGMGAQDILFPQPSVAKRPTPKARSTKSSAGTAAPSAEAATTVDVGDVLAPGLGLVGEDADLGAGLGSAVSLPLPVPVPVPAIPRKPDATSSLPAIF